MAAVTLEGTPICYDWLITLGSLVAVVVLMIAGIKVAGNDIFATPDRVKLLEDIVGNNYVTEREARWSIFWVTSFHKLQFLAAGSFLAASGAIVMHYTGMMAQRGPFRMQWNVGFIAASSVIAIIICFVGFWIIFRMRWKIKQASLRLASAAIIALAVCGLHFFGMLSVTYYADSDSSGVCQRTWDQHNASPSSWTDFQIIVLVVGMFIPMLSLFISNIMNQELILAYEGAAHSKAIVSSLFPTQIRDKMLADDKKKLRNFLSKDPETTENSDDLLASKPIADLFPETTIMFADIAGFTSWSSEREPSQVFMLLETLYQAFDEISKRHGVFKVKVSLFLT